MYIGGEELWSSFGVVISMIGSGKLFIGKEGLSRLIWTYLSQSEDWNGKSY